LRGAYQPARIQKGLGKKKKRPPRSAPLQVQINGRKETKSIPIERYPALIVTLLFDKPDILFDVEPIEEELTGGVALGNLPTHGEFLKEHLDQGAVSFEPLRKAATSRHLGRMLAKIGHSFAVAELGLNAFNSFLQPIILGTDVRYLPHYVGGTRTIPSSSENIYEINLNIIRSKLNRQYYMVSIRLLADVQGMPEYWVVVGKPL
jgi:hypothetical protein